MRTIPPSTCRVPRFPGYLLAVWLVVANVLGCCSPVGAQERPQIEARVKQSEVYQGDTVTYQVIVLNIGETADLHVPESDEYTLSKVDEQAVNQRVWTNTNGHQRNNDRSYRIFVYDLVPTRAGDITIAAPTMRLASGTELQGNVVKIHVIGAEKQDRVFLEANCDRPHYYLSQPIRLSLTVGIQALPGDSSRENPLRLYTAAALRGDSYPPPPQLTIPWLDDERLPTALKPEVDASKILSDLYNDRGIGFQVNQIGRNRMNSIFRLSPLLNSTTLFQPKPVMQDRKDLSGKEQTFWTYQFDRTFLGQDIGTFVVNSATLKGIFIGIADGNRPVRMPVFVASEPVSIQVLDAPTQGRPDDYIGAIGKFVISSRLSSTEARVGDPLELEVTLRGRGTMNRIHPPDIANQPGIRGSFRLHEPTEKTTDEVKQFVYNVRPIHANVTEFPSFGISYFDVDTEKYVTLHSPAIPLKVLPSDQLADDDIVNSANAATVDDRTDIATSTLQPTGTTALPPLMAASQFRHDGVNWPSWFGVWLSMLTSYTVAVLLIRHRRENSAVPAARHRQQSLARAKKQLLDVRKRVAKGDSHDAATQLREIIMQLIADQIGGCASGMTSMDATSYLRSQSAAPELVDDVTNWLAKYDAVRFGTESQNSHRLDEGTEVVERLISAMQVRSVG